MDHAPVDTAAPTLGAAALDREAAEHIARNLRAIADPTRIQILRLILDTPGGRRPVTELATELGLSQPTVSHHLKTMADEGVLDREQVGRTVWYSMAPQRVSEVYDAVRTRDATDSVSPEALARITDDLATRFRGTFSPETVRDYVAESAALLSERSHITNRLPSLTAQFAGDRLRALAEADGLETGDVPDILFVCVQNAGRSQLASAILRSLAGDRVRVLTAGSEPAGSINPLIVAALDEVGIPVGGEYPKPLTDEVVRAADYVITMGCGDACPIYPGRKYLDWDLPDPATMTLDGVREVRDEIDRRVRELLADVNAG